MKEFLEFVIRRLVEHPDEVVVVQGEDGDFMFFKIAVRKSDAQRVVGRNEHTLNAIRSLLEAAAERQGKKVAVELETELI